MPAQAFVLVLAIVFAALLFLFPLSVLLMPLGIGFLLLPLHLLAELARAPFAVIAEGATGAAAGVPAFPAPLPWIAAQWLALAAANALIVRLFAIRQVLFASVAFAFAVGCATYLAFQFVCVPLLPRFAALDKERACAATAFTGAPARAESGPNPREPP